MTLKNNRAVRFHGVVKSMKSQEPVNATLHFLSKMSVVLITNHDESIYNISSAAEEVLQHINPPMYKSQIGAKLKKNRAYTRGKRQHATMGLPQETLPDPAEFLKKKTGQLVHYVGEDDKHVCYKPPPKPNFMQTQEQVTEFNRKRKEEAKKERNFIAKNVKEVLRMKPKEPEQRVVLEPHGESKRLQDGLEPIYITSKWFAKTPPYLSNLIKKAERLHQMQKDMTGVERPKCQYITRDQREKLLNGLKYNWEELQKLYQGLPILTDTIPKINRKAKLEAELKQLEKDIVLVERHPYIYIYDDNAPFT